MDAIALNFEDIVPAQLNERAHQQSALGQAERQSELMVSPVFAEQKAKGTWRSDRRSYLVRKSCQNCIPAERCELCVFCNGHELVDQAASAAA